MRKFLISMLLAGAVASPAFAQDEDHGRWHHDRSQSDNSQQSQQNERHEERSQPARPERPQFEARQQQFEGRQQQQPEIRQQQQAEVRQQQVEAVERHQRADGVSRWTRDNNQQAGETSRWTRDPDQRAGETSRWTRDRTGWTRDGDLRQGDRPVPVVMQSRNPLAVEQSRRNATNDQLRNRTRWASGGWNREWRNDRRYDWRSYRNHHRSIFHPGVYFDPFGFGYRQFNIGYNLGPAYYSQQYWIDPEMYSLPYPPPGTQWVRYWNDALLVDVYSGEIVDVIQNFFW